MSRGHRQCKCRCRAKPRLPLYRLAGRKRDVKLISNSSSVFSPTASCPPCHSYQCRCITAPTHQPSSSSRSCLPRGSCSSSSLAHYGTTGSLYSLVRLSLTAKHIITQRWVASLTHPRLALTFVLAPLPNSVCGRYGRADGFSEESNSAYVDFGRFLTGMFVVCPHFAPWPPRPLLSGRSRYGDRVPTLTRP